MRLRITRLSLFVAILVIVTLLSVYSVSNASQATTDPSRIIDMAISPTSDAYALLRYGGSVEILNLAGEQLKQYNIDLPFQDPDDIDPAGLTVRNLEYSPSGQYVAVSICDIGYSGDVYIIDIVNDIIDSSHSLRCVVDMKWKNNNSMVLALKSGSGDALVFTEISVLNLSTGQIETTLFDVAGPLVRALDLAEAGTLAYVIEADLVLYDLVAEEEQSRVSATTLLMGVSWSPSGQYIATQDYENNVTIWDANTLTTVFTFTLENERYIRTDLLWLDLSHLVVSSRQGIAIWNIPHQSMLVLIPTDDYFATSIIKADDSQIIYSQADYAVVQQLNGLSEE